MADNLPLIPSKSADCKDVRPVLRRVFRELDFLPPLATEGSTQRNIEAVGEHGDHILPPANCWTEQYRKECQDISNHEDDIKDQFAQRIAKESLPNIFKLHRPEAIKETAKWKLEKGLIDRKDLMPNIEQNAGREGSLWIKNILNASSHHVSIPQVSTPCVPSPAELSPADDVTVLSYSIGKVRSHLPPPSISKPSTPIQPQYIVCLPSELEFVNCSVGHQHTKCLRLVNVSKFECRLSVSPTKCRELDIEISSFRGLVVTPGASVELKVHFRPTDVRALKDAVAIRVSCGQAFTVPISCYMQPPLLRISVAGINSSMHLSGGEYSSESIPSSASPIAANVVELGSRLLGDVHCARVLLNCDDQRAAFFMLTEDAWNNWNINCVTSCGSLVADEFVWWPSLWRGGGGGVTHACAWCRALHVGVHVASLRLLSHTAISRPLQLLADVLYFHKDHLVIQAHEKDYDICSEDDPDCEYYVNLGTALPHRALSATVLLVNKSPILYHYHWTIRPWGICHCWEEYKESTSSLGSSDTDQLCIGAVAARHMSQENPDVYKKKEETARLVTVKPERGYILPRSTSAIQVRVPDAGEDVGVQRAVVMLILENIPKESFPEDYDPMIVRTRHVESTPIPGIQTELYKDVCEVKWDIYGQKHIELLYVFGHKRPTIMNGVPLQRIGPTIPRSAEILRWRREVCEVVATQMEVWWRVVPLRFVLDPPIHSLHHSRRVQCTEVRVGSWQLYGSQQTPVWWVMPERLVQLQPPPPALLLSVEHPATTTLTVPLPSLPDHYPETDLLTLVADNDEWKTKCIVTRQCELRHPTIHPCKAFLGVVPPGTNMKTMFQLSNETYQNIYYWCEAYRWFGENEPRPACYGGRSPPPSCGRCGDGSCTCDLVLPRRGALEHGHIAQIHYNVNAPTHDGCVATLVQARRCEADVGRVRAGPATAALVAYRVLAPRLTARVLPCFGLNPHCSEGCGLDEGAAGSKLGTAVLRPSSALVVGRHTCYRLRLNNITPLHAAVHFDTPADGTDLLKIKFTPNDFNVNPYGQVDVRVVVEPLQVSARRIYVYRALVQRAHRPLYLVLDTALTGVRVSCQVPLGGDVTTDDFIIITRSQRQADLRDSTKNRPLNHNEIFAEEDRKRAFINENICRCPFKMVYIPPAKVPEQPSLEEECGSPVDIVEQPPPSTRVCPCDDCAKPYVREAPESISLQFVNIPLGKVCERVLTLRNESVVTAHWTATVRRWPRKHVRGIIKDQWYGEHSPAYPGVSLWCRPARGVVCARAGVSLRVRVAASCWGLYRDQLLIQIDNVEPIVLDVWVQAVGAPLVLGPLPAPHSPPRLPAPPSPPRLPAPTLWVSASDPRRSLLASNVSCSELAVRAYLTIPHECEQDVLPFRLYLHFYDLPPVPCSCYIAHDCDVGEISKASFDMEMDTGIDLYLAPDCGPQDSTYYKVRPEECSVEAGACIKWDVELNKPTPPHAAPGAGLLLRLTPRHYSRNECWYRPDPPPLLVRLRQAVREARLELACDDVTVNLCALELPHESCLRVRKRLCIQNVGNGVLDLIASTTSPWCLLQEGTSADDDDLSDMQPVHRKETININLPPRSSLELSVEVCVYTRDVCACVRAEGDTHRATTSLHLYHHYQLFKSVPLILAIEFPLLQVHPTLLDFGFVTDGDSRKSYITVSHTSRTNTLKLVTRWVGSKDFEIWPPSLEVPPGGSSRVYIQYTAVWRLGVSEGYCHVSPGGEGEAPAAWWCEGAGAAARASPTRDTRWHLAPHDHTDLARPLPPAARDYLSSSLDADISH